MLSRGEHLQAWSPQCSCTPSPEAGSTKRSVTSNESKGSREKQLKQKKGPETGRIIKERKLQKTSHPQFYSLVLWSDLFSTRQQQPNGPKARLTSIVSVRGKGEKKSKSEVKSSYRFLSALFPLV